MILNLARKWRSRTFNEIVGQDLSVMILKNTLYLGHFFPVYLFSGQRGCGKTTTARIFASSLNCSKLEDFQKDPKQHTLPCLACASCDAMRNGSHPDFIEIDAASHTGVDHVRQIVDAASLLPVLGRKKIYLIDEAHMLSKSAFNAFLKILEEPPATVLFILATTDPHKIIETVRSRCFQLFFRAIPAKALFDHLTFICQQENITAHPDGLMSLINATQGSARDALNLLEQVRFSAAEVDQQAVLKVLGYCDDEKIIQLFSYCAQANTHELLLYMQRNMLEQYDVLYIWQRIIDLLQDLISIKFGMAPTFFMHQQEALNAIGNATGMSYIRHCLQLCYQHELQLQKTAVPYKFFTMLLFDMADFNASSVTSISHTESGHKKVQVPKENSSLENKELVHPVPSNQRTQMPEEVCMPRKTGIWQQFLAEIPVLADPLIESIFKQATCKELDADQGKIFLQFASELSFFEDMLDKAAYAWRPVLEKIAGCSLKCVYEFSGSSSAVSDQKKTEKVVATSSVKNAIVAPPSIKKTEIKKNDFPVKKFNTKTEYTTKKRETIADVSDKQKWPIAHMLLTYFPGKISYLEEGYNE